MRRPCRRTTTSAFEADYVRDCRYETDWLVLVLRLCRRRWLYPSGIETPGARLATAKLSDDVKAIELWPCG